MKNKISILTVMLIAFWSTNSYAQFNPYSEEAKMATVGVGASGWGIPVFARYEHPVADNITVGGSISYQSTTESYSSSKWKHSIFGLNGRGSYHFNELMKANDSWDFYAGPSLGYFFWDTKYDNVSLSNYSGSGSGGFSIGAHVGVRYFVSEKIAINADAGAGSVLGGGTIGVTFIL